VKMRTAPLRLVYFWRLMLCRLNMVTTIPTLIKWASLLGTVYYPSGTSGLPKSKHRQFLYHQCLFVSCKIKESSKTSFIILNGLQIIA